MVDELYITEEILKTWEETYPTFAYTPTNHVCVDLPLPNYSDDFPTCQASGIINTTVLKRSTCDFRNKDLLTQELSKYGFSVIPAMYRAPVIPASTAFYRAQSRVGPTQAGVQ